MFFYTPAAVPYGMAKLAPFTNGHYGNPSGWEAVGYDTRQNSIEGFVHFHEWQVGGVSFMPTTGVLKVKPGQLEGPSNGYRSHFDRRDQVAEPGYYKVLLDDYNITAELTATKRVGFHRYTFPKNDHSHIILDIGNKQGESGEVTDAGITMVDGTHFEGFVITNPKYVQSYDPGGNVSMYFYGEINKKPESVGAFTAAQMAKALGKKEDYQTLIRYSNGWQSILNPQNKLMQPKKADGAFIDKFNPYEPWRGFQEGNAVQYTFYLPHNPASLIAVVGRDQLNNRLDSIFTLSEKDGFGGGQLAV